MGVQRRQAVRVLLLDRDDRILLLHGLDPAVPGVTWWITPGGGLEPGETDLAAARRELSEEVGLTRVDLGPLVAYGTVSFSFQGRRYEQEQRYYVVRTDCAAVDVATVHDTDEHALVTGARWWTATELRETSERVYPAELPELVEQLVTDGPPVPPVGL